MGLDEIFLDVTDVIHYNVDVLPTNLGECFFQLDKHDPTVGFPYDSSKVVGHCYPAFSSSAPISLIDKTDSLLLRLSLASHLALHIRQQLEHDRGYTCAVGVSTSKLLSKLVGSVNKPNAVSFLDNRDRTQS